MSALLVYAKNGKQDRKKKLCLTRKGQAVVKSGNVQLLVEVRKNGSLWELWKLEESKDGVNNNRRMYDKGLDASSAWAYCIEMFSIDLASIK